MIREIKIEDDVRFVLKDKKKNPPCSQNSVMNNTVIISSLLWVYLASR